jgi:hypothetical protein
MSKWLSSKIQTITDGREDTEKKYPCTVGGIVNKWNHCVKLYGRFSKHKNQNYLMIQQYLYYAYMQWKES